MITPCASGCRAHEADRGTFGAESEPDELKETVVESIHEYVIESDIDT